MELSVADAIAQALAVASEYSIAKDEELSAADEAKSAAMRMLPAVRADATVVYNSPAPGSGQSFLSENSVLWYRGTVGLSGTVLGGLGAQLKADRALLAAAHAGTEIARRDLVQATVDAYFGVSLANAQVAAAEGTLKVEEELARVTALRFTGGEVPEVDVLRTRTLVAAAKDTVFSARAAALASQANLAALVGSDAPSQVAPLTMELSPMDAVEGAAPVVTQAEASEDAAKAEVAAARAANLPAIEYGAGYGVDTDTLGAGVTDHLGVIASVAVTVPIFDWGIGSRAVAAAKLGADQADIARQIAARQQVADLAGARAAAGSASERAAALLESLPDAERAAAISLSRYQAGEADLVELSEAQQSLSDARSAANQALADYQVASWRLHLLGGP